MFAYFPAKQSSSIIARQAIREYIAWYNANAYSTRTTLLFIFPLVETWLSFPFSSYFFFFLLSNENSDYRVFLTVIVSLCGCYAQVSYR